MDVTNLILALSAHSEVKISRLDTDDFLVAVFPRGHLPLWWYSVGTGLQDALERAAEKARRYGFSKDEHAHHG